MKIESALWYGLADVLTFRLGRRPFIKSEAVLWGLVFQRFECASA